MPLVLKTSSVLPRRYAFHRVTVARPLLSLGGISHGIGKGQVCQLARTTVIVWGTSRRVSLLWNRDFIEEYGVKVNVLGDLQMLPEDLRDVMAAVMDASKHETKMMLNVCFAYTSRQVAGMIVQRAIS